MTRPRTDTPQRRIVERLRAHGASVAITTRVKDGFPDLAVGIYGLTALVEVKNGKEGFTEKEVKFREGWNGLLFVARTEEDADYIIMDIKELAEA